MTTTRRINAKRLLAAVMAVLMLCAMTAAMVSAKSINDFTWFQSTGRKVIDLGQMNPGSNPNTSGIDCFFVATSPSYGEFRVVLQRKGLFGIWQNIDGDLSYRTVSQHSERRYDSRNGGYVNGQPNLMVWPTNQSGEYRIIMEDATAPQATGITRMEVWAY